MTTYKLVRIKAGKLYPLFVECGRELPMGEWLEAGVGKLVGENSVASRIGPLSLRPRLAQLHCPVCKLDREAGKRWTALPAARYRLGGMRSRGGSVGSKGPQGSSNNPGGMVRLPHQSATAVSLDHFKQNPHHPDSATI